MLESEVMNVEKTMQFIMEHQAKHEVEIQQLREVVRGLAKNQVQLQQTVRNVTRGHAQLKQTVRGLVAIVGDVTRQNQELAQENRKFAKLQRHDHADLQALIRAVHNLVRRNGRGRR